MIVFVVLSVMLQGYACLELFKTNTLHKILSFSIIFYLVIWIFLPGVISILIYFGLLEEYISSAAISDEYIVLYGLESIIFLCVVSTAIYIGKMKIKAKMPQAGGQITLRFSVIALLGFSLTAGALFILSHGLDYSARNDASAYDSDRAYVLLEIINGILEGAVIYAAITLKGNRLVTILLFASLLMVALIETLNGARIMMLLPVFVYFSKMHFRSRDFAKKAFKMAILSALVAALLMPFAIAISKVRSEGIIDMNSVIESGNEAGASLAEGAFTLFMKFNSFSSGLDLIDGYGPGSAGIAPYIGSVLIFMPRFIFPDRPVSGSIDGTIYGTPARLVPQLYMNSLFMNVGVSPFSISVWHFGWLFGAIVLVIAGTLNLLLLQHLLTRRSALYKIIAIYTIQIPTFMGLFNSPDALVKNDVVIAVMSIGLFVLLDLGRRAPRIHRASPPAVLPR